MLGVHSAALLLCLSHLHHLPQPVLNVRGQRPGCIIRQPGDVHAVCYGLDAVGLYDTHGVLGRLLVSAKTQSSVCCVLSTVLLWRLCGCSVALL